MLWGHVTNRPDDLSVFSQSSFGFRLCVGWASVQSLLGQTEIKNLDLPARGDHYILGLDVAVNDAARMRFGQCFGRLDSDIDDFSRSQRFVLKLGPERHAVDVLHDDERRVSLFVDFMNSTDVRMIECSSGFCFSEQPLLRLFVFDRFSRQDLDRDAAIER